MRKYLLLLAIVALMFNPSPAKADSWPPGSVVCQWIGTDFTATCDEVYQLTGIQAFEIREGYIMVSGRSRNGVEIRFASQPTEAALIKVDNRFPNLLRVGGQTVGDRLDAKIAVLEGQSSHSHANKSILDATQASFTTVMSQGLHTHSNQSILDGTQQSFTTSLKTSYDWLVTNITSSWKTAVDSFVSSKGQVSGLAPLDANSKVPTANLGGSGADNTKYLRGDQTWVTPAGGSVDPIATIDLYDEFLTGTLATGDVGDLGWAFTTTAPTVTASVANHPGIRRINTSTTSGAVNAFWPGGAATNDLIQFDEQWDFTFIVSVPTITTVSVFTGAMDGMVTAVGNQDRYGFEFNPATSAYWRMVTGNGSASTSTNTDVTVVAGTWYKLRVVRTPTGVTYYINGVSKGSISTTLPDTPLSYGFHVQTLAASARNLDCDFFRMSLTGVTR